MKQLIDQLFEQSCNHITRLEADLNKRVEKVNAYRMKPDHNPKTADAMAAEIAALATVLDQLQENLAQLADMAEAGFQSGFITGIAQEKERQKNERRYGNHGKYPVTRLERESARSNNISWQRHRDNI